VALSMRLFLLFRNSEVMTLLPDSASFTQLLREIWETRHFIKFNFPCNILNTANLQLPPILLHLKYSEDVVGLFSMARNIVSIPATLSSRSLGQVFYPKAAREYREGQGLKTITWQTFIYSCRLTIFPTLFIVSAAGFVLPLLLGERWSGVATYMILLLPMILLSAIQTQIGVGFIFNILNQPLKILWGNVFLFVSRMVPLGFVLVFVSTHPYIPVFVYSVGSGVGYALLLVWIFMTTSISVRRAFFEWAKLFALAVVCVSPMGVSLLSKNPWVLGLLVLISILLYGIGAWFTFLTREDRKVLIARTMTWLRFGKKAGPIFAKTSKE
jgi:O-antigen/teichoic acid export membrane protein